MKRHYWFFMVASALLFITIAACKKSDNANSAITVANLSGTYKLAALNWFYGGVNYNVYDSLPACEKDNLIKLNPDLTAIFIDAGIVCNPPLDDHGVWHLSNDSLYFGANAAKIKSFDGKTLVLTGYPTSNGVPDSTVSATTTLIKQ